VSWPGLIQVTTAGPPLMFEARFYGFQHTDEPAARGPEVQR